MAVVFCLLLSFFCGSVFVSAAPASSFSSIQWTAWNNQNVKLFTDTDTYFERQRSDYTDTTTVECRFSLPSAQTDSVVSLRLEGLYYDDIYAQGFFRPVMVSAYVYHAGVQVEQLSINSDSSNFGTHDYWYQIDCSTLRGSSVVVTFVLENESVLSTSTLKMSAYVNSLDNAKPDGWMARIWNAIRDGFSSVGRWISSQTSALVAKFDELISHFSGTAEQQQQAEQQGNAQAQQQQDINGSVNDLGQMQRPDLGSVDTGQFQNIQVPTAFSAIMNQPMVVQMLLAVGTLAIFSYLLYGKRG